MVSIGGFFAGLKLVTDDNSIQQGLAKFGKIPGSLKAVALGAVGVGAAMVAMATETASALTKLDAQSRALGINARTLDNWKQAVNLAGGDADGFVQSLANMNEAFRNLKIGEVKEDFIKATGMSGANFAALQGMNNDQRFRAIWGALEKVSDRDKQAALIEKIFGAGGLDTFYRAQQQGKSLFGLYNEANARNPLTGSDYAKAIEGDRANREIGVSLKKAMDDVGIEIEKALLPDLKAFAEWLKNHKQDLADFATAVGSATSAILKFIGFFNIFNPNKDSARNTMLGGDESARRMNIVEQQMGIKKDSLEESFFWLSPLWHSISKAKTIPGFENAPAVSGMSDILSQSGTSLNNVSAFVKYSGAIERNAALSGGQRYEAEKGLFDKISANPNVNLTVNVDKSGNVTVTDDKGRLMASSNSWTGKR